MDRAADDAAVAGEGAMSRTEETLTMLNGHRTRHPTRHWLRTLVMPVLACAAAGAAWAQNTIQAITSTQQGGAEVVRIELAQPLAALPAGFSTQTPPRIAIDLPGVANGLGRNSVEMNTGNLRNVNVAQAGERTRLVLVLKQPASYRAQLQGNALLLSLEPSAAPAAPDIAQFAPAQNAQPQGLRDVDFRRGPEGSGRIVVTLPSTQVGVDIRQQGQSLVVEFLRSTLPERLRRRLDVTDFGTPVNSVATFQSGDNVRMVVEPRGNWEHSAYQTDNQFVLEVRPARVDPNKLTQGPGFSGEKLSLNFQNIDVRALLQVIADFTNFNVVTSDSVTGTVTLRLKDVPWDQALDIILQSKGLGVRKTGNVLWIAPKEELAQREQVELEARRKVAELEPVRTQSFQLNYARAEDVARGLIGQVQGLQGTGGVAGTNVTRLLTPRGSVIHEPRTNQLFVTDIPSKLEEVQALIARIDIAVRQVQIEARIVEADDRFGRSLGVKLGTADMRGLAGGIPGYNVGGSNYLTFGGNYNAVGYQTRQTSGTTSGSGSPPFTDTQFVNLPANVSNLGGAQAASFALTLFSAAANRFLNLELSALEAEGKGKVISSPRVVTTDQQKAQVSSGEELPYQAATSSGATNIQFREATLKLDVTPHITPEGNVILTVEVKKDSVGRNTVAGFAINKNEVKTQVLVENGGTVVIGGIFQQTERNEVNKVPVLGDVPVLGHLFTSRARSTNRTELLVFITPKIITDRSAVR
jgi:type IV pilus assembly protein PilQ